MLCGPHTSLSSRLEKKVVSAITDVDGGLVFHDSELKPGKNPNPNSTHVIGCCRALPDDVQEKFNHIKRVFFLCTFKALSHQNKLDDCIFSHTEEL